MTAIEYCDLYDENGVPLNKTVVRGTHVENGEHYLAVHVWIQNSAGEYLIQQRSPQKSYPNMWAPTAGAVTSGETGRGSAQREIEEEIGLTVDPQALRFIGQRTDGHVVVELWTVLSEVALADLTLQVEEVSAVQWVSQTRLLEMIADGSFWDYGEAYFKQVFSAVNRS